MSNLVTFQQQMQNYHGKRIRYKLLTPNLVSNSIMCCESASLPYDYAIYMIDLSKVQ